MRRNWPACNEDLARFEQRYAMNSADFFARYRAGQMGDDADVFEWNVALQDASGLPMR